MPKRNTEVSSRESVPRVILGSRTVIDRPASINTPRATSTRPRAMVTHGKRSLIELRTGSKARPSTPNTTTKPAVMAAPTLRARRTLRPGSLSSG